MRPNPLAFFMLFLGISHFQARAQQDKSKTLESLPTVITEPTEYNDLTPNEKYVILEKGTEWAFSGAFHAWKETGTYICKQCNQPLFHSDAKFDSGTGWPSFDEYLTGSVQEVPDKDGRRTEIICSNCKGHLGHVFFGESFTSKQTRHCVNSISLDFVPQPLLAESKEQPRH
jgi:methionine-R-sulfoxide reductase